jgi:hypothetical protein
MTYDDLRTLVRDDVTTTEPTHGLDAMVPIQLGRRRMRTRRLAAGVTTAVVMAVGAAVAIPLAIGNGSASPERGMDPATRKALDDYDPQQMPTLMDDHVRSVLERSVPDLGPVTFRAGDANSDELPSNLYGKASGMSVTYGTQEHEYSVDLSHAKSEAEGSAHRYCEEMLRAGYALTCTVDTTTAGDVVITELEAKRPTRFLVGGERSWMAVTADELATVNPDRLWFDHRIKVIKSESLVTYVDESVKAPTREAAEAAFLVPVADLVEIGTDPVLVIPPPPLADDGCGAFVLDPAHGKLVCDDSH